MPIGVPVDNNRLYVLDANLQLVPIGVPGELVIGGKGVARGYLGRPELTADRFVADPFGSEPGARMYRTGDLVRRLAGGDIEFLGRIDQQVKVRGHRIEPGEIESVLARAPRHHPHGRHRLPARSRRRPPGRLLHPRRPANLPAVESLRSHLRAKLPDYMVPATYMALEAFPTTPNNKVDRARLPTPDTHRRPPPTRLAPGSKPARSHLGKRPRNTRSRPRRRLLRPRRTLPTRHPHLRPGRGADRPTTSAVGPIQRRHDRPPGRRRCRTRPGRRPGTPARPGTATLDVIGVGPDRGFPTARSSTCPLPRSRPSASRSWAGTSDPTSRSMSFSPRAWNHDEPFHTSVEEMAAHYIREMKEVQPRGPTGSVGTARGAGSPSRWPGSSRSLGRSSACSCWSILRRPASRRRR